ncbi:hypothetical protein FHK96_04805 [Escherichia coli]|nr:hypothetical protein [Escherichia coli]EFA4479763.1 hypothetical protein [Escherichia coli O2]EFB5432029.1 hypothetical protein [Escherichia coli O157]OUD18706.1 hypothetical protein BVA22_02625 [Escherichia coli M4]QEI69007.1 hypothetical protein FYA02_24440 [Escherichia coli O80:H26]TFU76349.1 hypothetical protein E4T96_06660 [Shigella flexneri]
MITDEATFRSVNFLATAKPAINAIVKQVTKAIKLIINFHLSMLIIFHYQCYSLKRVTCQQCNDQYIVSIMF